MDQKYCAELARIRLERAIELLDESEDLLKKEKYKSANNRSYYAMEKAIKALLAMKGVDAATHSGNLKQFNYFYIASKESASKQVKSARDLVEKIRNATGLI